MAINVTKPSVNLREKLNELETNKGLKGNEILQAETAQEVRSLIGAAGRKNLIINGDFRVSQRGDYTTAVTMVHNTYMLDRWKNTNGVTATIQDLGGYLEVKATAASGASTLRLSQLVEDIYRLEGQIVTISCEMKSNSINGRLQMHNGAWVATSASHTGGGDWENLSFTTTMPSSLAVTSIQVGLDGVSSANVPIAIGDYCQIKNVQLELGSVATDFEHRSYGEELALCQRYCLVKGGESVNELFLWGTGNGTGTATGILFPPVPFRVRPSLTLSGRLDINVYNFNSSASLGNPTNNGSVITSISSTNTIYIDFTITGGTSGSTYMIRADNNLDARFILNAEL
jgi:hypothetical protein